jgi:geranylgeranyl pyrophosphate synthase
MSSESAARTVSRDHDGLATRVDGVLEGFLGGCRERFESAGMPAPVLVDEISRLVHAGGKRTRPACCYWGYRAAGGEEGEPIVRAAAALELLHTMALIHDDLMDGSVSRRGVPTSASHLAGVSADLGLRVDPASFGRSAAMLAGDLAAVLADRLLLESGFEPDKLARALEPYHAMREAMAAGQVLDIAGLASDPDLTGVVARLKGGAYSVEGPLLVGAALAGGKDEVVIPLAAFGSALGEAFQLRDDLVDGDAAIGVDAARINELVARARSVVSAASFPVEAAAALDRIAEAVAMP